MDGKIYPIYSGILQKRIRRKRRKQHLSRNGLIKETAISSTTNTFLALLLLAGVLLLPSAIFAELDLDSISAQISSLQESLTDYYVSLLSNLESVISSLTNIINSLSNISNQLTTQTNILLFIIRLIQNLRRRSLDETENLAGETPFLSFYGNDIEGRCT